VYLAFLWRYPGDDGPRHVDLGISRNGEDWSFFGTNWYIPLGSEEEELSMYGLIRRGDQIWQYVDEGGAHGGSAARYYYRYKQRLDGFVSLDGGGTTGTATTLPMIFEGRELGLNVAAAAGWVKVGLLDEYGTALPGFDVNDCDAIDVDSVEHIVSWGGDSYIKMYAGQVVRLRIEMQNAKLHAFQFGYLCEGAADDPSPADGAQDVAPDVVLEWSPGRYAAEHDVYVGTDFNSVRDANTSSSEYKESLHADVNSYDPCGHFELGVAHYWRIDEVNDGNKWKGRVWSFTPANCLVLDDMEPYNDTTNKIFHTWLVWPYPDLDNGGNVILERVIVHGGSKAMLFEYCNLYPYSTATRIYSSQDLATLGAEVLALWLRGESSNDVNDQPYVKLKDGSGRSASAGYGDEPNNVTSEEWRLWVVEMEEFSAGGVDLSDIEEVIIGSAGVGLGCLYYDDIQLCVRSCVGQFAPRADLTGDCTVDLTDFGVLGGQWLDAPGIPSADIAPEIPDGVVDWKDLSVLGNEWLAEQLWP
jgi:hypothetical protein